MIEIRVPGALARWLLGDRGVALALTVGALAVYLGLIIGHSTPFDYFGRVAVAMLQGHLWLDGAPLSEIALGRGGHFYNEQPPGPVLLLVPLVLFKATAQTEVFLSAVLGALVAAPQYLALRALTVPRSVAVWCTVFALFGTTLLFTATDGRSWFLANAGACFFGCVALWLAATERSPIAIGLALGFGALCNTTVGLAAPGLLLLPRRDQSSWRALARNALLLSLGVLPFALIQILYDLVRWGDPFSIYGPQLRDLTIGTMPRGRWSLTYLPRHITAMFFVGPAFADNQLLFLRPRGVGMAILMGSPAFVWLARSLPALPHDPRWRALAIAAVGVLLPTLLVPVVGAEQYGYRYSLLYQPYLIALLAVGVGWSAHLR